MKIVINKCFGGFGLSHKAIMRFAELKGIKVYGYVDEGYGSTKKLIPIEENKKESYFLIHYATKPNIKNYNELNENYYSFRFYDKERSDLDLIKVVEELGDEANGDCAELEIIEIPDNVDYIIEEYDGQEWISENHRTWN